MVRDKGEVAMSHRYPEAAKIWAREGKLRAADGQHLDFGLLGSSAQHEPVFRPAIQSYIALLGEEKMTLLTKATCFFERAEYSCVFISDCQILAIGKLPFIASLFKTTVSAAPLPHCCVKGGAFILSIFQARKRAWRVPGSLRSLWLVVTPGRG